MDTAASGAWGRSFSLGLWPQSDFSNNLLEEKHVSVDFRWGDSLTIIKNVPAKVCHECAERYYAATVVRQLEHLAKEGRTEKELSVPVMSWA